MTDRCPICTLPAATPYRRHDLAKKIYEGCVADYHTGSLAPNSEDLAWHERPESVRCRAGMASLRGAK